ncbi:arginine ABC transporter permease [Gordoniibacillus kamchatkensis]|uniref:Arginine ABC transporter permease n=1 Tax=Gordoniibacillus kamchatkensis TaxID=1590651 RepID=A0ABR5AFW0_9BACL|nr:amino acid ABC transporter permease [Paenibacillus sp. VKM B-2647]KIL39943.1 arginine ABC transporter permease [Paenibacillus sp. VKM B-2647]
MDFSFLDKYWIYFVKGTEWTIFLSVFTVLFGFIIGVVLALLRMSNIKVIKFIAVAYIEFMRGTPLLVQIYLIYYCLPFAGVTLPDYVAAILTLSLNSGAYIAEIFRAGIQNLDKGQMEAARSLGMPHRMAMRYIVLPQAFRNILPALGNELVVVIKESSIVSVIGITELMYQADTVRGIFARPFEPLIIAAIVYFIMTFTLSKLLGRWEGRLKRA